MQIFQCNMRLMIAAGTLALCLSAHAEAPKRPVGAPAAGAASALVKPSKKTLEAGLNAYHDDRYDEAYPLLRPHADSGDVDATMAIAYMLDYGYGVQKDKTNAMRFYRFAAERDNAYAQNNLAVMLRDGEVGAPDLAQAWQWFRKAATLGHAEAMVSVGVMLEKGRGVTKNETAANEWFLKSAEQGNVKGAYNIAYNLRYGIGTKKHEAEARRWFRFAAEGGDEDSRAELAK